MSYKISRRDFLKLAGISVGSIAFAGCAGTAPETTVPPTAAPATEPPPPEEVVLEVHSMNPEYENAEHQIWSVFEAENPGVKIQMFSVNEDQEAAHEAKIAGGWLPDIYYISHRESVNQNNYEKFVDLSTIDFPWFDRWQWDIRNTWSNMFGYSGPRSLEIFQGIVVSFIYHKDIVDQTGWDPQTQVKTQEDLRKFLADLNLFVKDNPDLDFAWDRGWINGFNYLRYMNLVPVAYADGSRERQGDCWFGRAKFNDPDSPFRHTFEFSKEMLESGFNTENWWNREWETDQEASFSAKRSALVLHGPWMWDKAMAANPEAQLAGFPFPSVDGQETIVHQANPGLIYGFSLLNGVQNKPHWDVINKAFQWWHSPKVVGMRAEALGQVPLYTLDEPLDLNFPQWNGLLKHVGGELWPNAKLDQGPWGEVETLPYLVKGGVGPWDQAGGTYNQTFFDAITGKISVQEALDAAQTNWESSFVLGEDGKLVYPEG
jgi:ABC-type glycerol-3-phosphate transport system substrate-binding protein